MRNAHLPARLVWLAAACLAARSGAQAQPPEKCGIAGRVVSATTGAPLKKATVWVEAFTPTRGVSGSPTVSGPTTTTDAEGRFSLENIDPGSYLLSARRTGYLTQGYGAAEPDIVGPPLKVNAGDRVGDLTLKLTPQSLLYARITDDEGEAIPDAEVMVYKVSYAGGRKQLAIESGTVSQADGSVIVGKLAPGRYYLGASISDGDQDSEAREVYVPTYYPGTADPSAAAPIEVAAGAEVRGVEIRLRKERTYRIRGRAAPNVALQLVPKDEGLAERPASGVNTGQDGRFEFTGVVPGRYTIEANETTAIYAAAGGLPEKVAAPAWVRPATVEVTDADLDDVVLPPGESVEITGSIVGGNATMRPIINLMPTGGGRDQPAGAQADASGAFRIHRIFPGAYEVAVSALPEGFYVKSVRFAGRDITNDNLDLTSGAGGALEIALSPDGAEIAGTVRNAGGDALPGVLVQLWPAGGGSARSVKSDESGGFRFAGLPPADYRLIAWESLDDDLAGYAPFRDRFETQAIAVKVAERAKERIEVKAIARDASAAEAAKLK